MQNTSMNNPRSSHTLLQVAQGNAVGKTCKRVCLPHPEKIVFKKFPTLKKNKKYATHRRYQRTTTQLDRMAKTIDRQAFQDTDDRRASANSGFVQAGVTCFVEQFFRIIGVRFFVSSVVVKIPA